MQNIQLAKEQVFLLDEKELVEKAELWTAKQRQMFPLHYTISYRGSFKAELPNYFISKYLPPMENSLVDDAYPIEERPIVFDPFSGRGTTALEANLMGFPAIANDINPMIERILNPLTNPVGISDICERLNRVPFNEPRSDIFNQEYEKFKPFYHEKTFQQILNLRDYLKTHRDPIDRFIEVLALSRLHGHSKGFFSAYSFPQISVLPSAQKKINIRHGDPEFRDIALLIVRKAQSVLKGKPESYKRLKRIGKYNKIYNLDSRSLDLIKDESINLIITSPPFLNQVDYILDNWLECWFLDIDQNSFEDKLVMTNSLEIWTEFMQESMYELARVLKPKCKLVIEVGDVNYKGDKKNLDEIVKALGKYADLKLEKVFINEQKFTKLSNCFKVENNKKGVNTNRMVVFLKP